MNKTYTFHVGQLCQRWKQSSSAVFIPSLNYRKNLQPSGVTEIEVPPQKAGTTLQGLCAMGMYNFTIKYN
jgi:hypothetical protein